MCDAGNRHAVCGWLKNVNTYIHTTIQIPTFIEYLVLEYNASSSTHHTREQVGNRGLWGEIKIKMPLRNNLSRLSVEEKNVYV